ncbi:hypothetical protein AAMO2058_000351300 [Amorphochlora amoebiformis]
MAPKRRGRRNVFLRLVLGALLVLALIFNAKKRGGGKFLCMNRGNKVIIDYERREEYRKERFEEKFDPTLGYKTAERDLGIKGATNTNTDDEEEKMPELKKWREVKLQSLISEKRALERADKYGFGHIKEADSARLKQLIEDKFVRPSLLILLLSVPTYHYRWGICVKTYRFLNEIAKNFTLLPTVGVARFNCTPDNQYEVFKMFKMSYEQAPCVVFFFKGEIINVNSDWRVPLKRGGKVPETEVRKFLKDYVKYAVKIQSKRDARWLRRRMEKQISFCDKMEDSDYSSVEKLDLIEVENERIKKDRDFPDGRSSDDNVQTYQGRVPGGGLPGGGLPGGGVPGGGVPGGPGGGVPGGGIPGMGVPGGGLPGGGLGGPSANLPMGMEEAEGSSTTEDKVGNLRQMDYDARTRWAESRSFWDGDEVPRRRDRRKDEIRFDKESKDSEDLAYEYDPEATSEDEIVKGMKSIKNEMDYSRILENNCRRSTLDKLMEKLDDGKGDKQDSRNLNPYRVPGRMYIHDWLPGDGPRVKEMSGATDGTADFDEFTSKGPPGDPLAGIEENGWEPAVDELVANDPPEMDFRYSKSYLESPWGGQ